MFFILLDDDILNFLKLHHSIQTGPSASTHLESGGFARTGTDVAHPDVQMHFLPSQVIDHGRKPAVVEAFQVSLQAHV